MWTQLNDFLQCLDDTHDTLTNHLAVDKEYSEKWWWLCDKERSIAPNTISKHFYTIKLETAHRLLKH